MKLRYDRRALKRLRTERGLDVGVVAQRAGMNRQNVVFLDSGLQEPRASTLAKLAGALEVPVGAFFLETEPAKGA